MTLSNSLNQTSNELEFSLYVRMPTSLPRFGSRRTNTAVLGRLFTLFLLSTLLVFEHMHAVLSSMLVICCTMVTTKHCCYGACMSNSRYADTDRMKNVFLIRFSKPHDERMHADWNALPLPLSRRTTIHVRIEFYG